MVDVIVPVLDEARALPWVLERMPPGHRPIVIDNGSVDESARVAREHGATVVEEPERGFGAACAAGLAAASAPVVCFMDGDASLDPAQLPRVSVPVATGAADLVLGARRAQHGAWPAAGRIANRALTAELRRRGGPRLRDLGPMRAARREALLALALRDRRFGYPLEMVVAAHRAGCRIAECEVGYLPRTGRSKVTGTVTGFARTVRDMAAVLG